MILGAGSRSRTLPIPGLAEHGIGFKTVTEAIHLRNRVLSNLDTAGRDSRRDTAALAADVRVRRRWLRRRRGAGGVGGSGAPRGKAVHGLGAEDLRWVLVEAAGRILPELGEDLAGYALARLEERGIEVRLSTRLESAVDGWIALSDGERFRADTLVWTAGVKASSLARRSGLPCDEAGRVVVDEMLHVVGVEDTWAAGDVAAVPDRVTGSVAPPSAQYALREARRLAGNVRASIEGGTAKAVPLAQPRRAVRAGALPRCGEGDGREGPRVPGVVPAPDVPPGADADDRSQGPHHARLDGRAVLPARPHAARVAGAPARAVRAGDRGVGAELRDPPVRSWGRRDAVF